MSDDVTQQQRTETIRRLGHWTESAAVDAALKQCRGDYQRGIVLGRYRWSGADLQGKAARYAGRYKRSRENLLKRLRDAGIPVRVETTNRHGLLELVFGT